MIIHESRVSLMRSEGNGFKNLAIPSECLSYETYINKQYLNNADFELFLEEAEDATNVKPYFADDEEGIDEEKEKKTLVSE